MLDFGGNRPTNQQCALVANESAASWAALMGAWPGEGGKWLLPFTQHSLVYVCSCAQLQERQTRASSVEDYQVGQGWSTHPWGEVEGLGLLQPGKETASGGPNSRSLAPTVGGNTVGRMTELGCSWWYMAEGWGTLGRSWNERFRLGIRRHLLTLRTVKWRIRLPRRVVQSVLKRFSRLAWIKPWTSRSGLMAEPAVNRSLDWDLLSSPAAWVRWLWSWIEVLGTPGNVELKGIKICSSCCSSLRGKGERVDSIAD